MSVGGEDSIDGHDLDALVEAALAARSNAYCPHSEYAVGASVVTDDGRTFTGVNVENASYGATVCAERVAIWTAIAAGARRITALAVVTSNGGTPCGICRQVLNEFADGATPVVVAAAAPSDSLGSAALQAYRVIQLRDLLPHAWGPDDLGDAERAL